MALVSVSKAIKEGAANASAHPSDYGITTAGDVIKRRGKNHPNATLLQPEMKSFTLSRQTMDVRKGAKGLVNFVVQAVDGPTAKRLVDDQVAAINEPFLKVLRRKDKD